MRRSLPKRATLRYEALEIRCLLSAAAPVAIGPVEIGPGQFHPADLPELLFNPAAINHFDHLPADASPGENLARFPGDSTTANGANKPWLAGSDSAQVFVLGNPGLFSPSASASPSAATELSAAPSLLSRLAPEVSNAQLDAVMATFAFHDDGNSDLQMAFEHSLDELLSNPGAISLPATAASEMGANSPAAATSNWGLLHADDLAARTGTAAQGPFAGVNGVRDAAAGARSVVAAFEAAGKLATADGARLRVRVAIGDTTVAVSATTDMSPRGALLSAGVPVAIAADAITLDQAALESGGGTLALAGSKPILAFGAAASRVNGVLDAAGSRSTGQDSSALAPPGIEHSQPFARWVWNAVADDPAPPVEGAAALAVDLGVDWRGLESRMAGFISDLQDLGGLAAVHPPTNAHAALLWVSCTAAATFVLEWKRRQARAPVLDRNALSVLHDHSSSRRRFVDGGPDLVS